MKEKALAREARGQKRVFIVSTCPTGGKVYALPFYPCRTWVLANAKRHGSLEVSLPHWPVKTCHESAMVPVKSKD